jgi:hypothetical protein
MHPQGRQPGFLWQAAHYIHVLHRRAGRAFNQVVQSRENHNPAAPVINIHANLTEV